MASRYRYLACDLITGNVREAVELVGVQAIRELNTPGDFTAAMPLAGLRNSDGTPNRVLQQARLDAVGDGRSTIVVVRDGVALGEWVIWSHSQANDSSPVRLKGSYITSYFDEVRPNFTGLTGDLPAGGWVATDQMIIGAALVQQCADPITITTAPPNSRGIVLTVPAVTLSGALVDQTDWATAGKFAGPMLNELATAAGGFDYDIDVVLAGNQVVRTANLAYPRRGIDAGLVLQPAQGSPGGNATHVATSGDGRRIATQIVGLGGGQGLGQVVTYSNNLGLVATYPLLQAVYSDTTIFELAALQKQSDAQAMNSRVSTEPPQVTILADKDPVLGSYNCGDYCTLVMGASDNYPYGYQLKMRITSILIQPPTAGPETVTLGLALIPES